MKTCSQCGGISCGSMHPRLNPPDHTKLLGVAKRIVRGLNAHDPDKAMFILYYASVVLAGLHGIPRADYLRDAAEAWDVMALGFEDAGVPLGALNDD